MSDRQIYSVITGNQVGFEDAVNRALKNGWHPQGGVCVHPPNGYSQAMVKVVEVEDGPEPF